MNFDKKEFEKWFKEELERAIKRTPIIWEVKEEI